MQLRQVHDGQHERGALLRRLLACIDVQVPERLVERAVSEPSASDWQQWTSRALPSLGLRASWVQGSVGQLAMLARPDMPLVTWLDRGIDPGWLVLDGVRWNRVHVWSSSALLPSGWYGSAELARLIGAGSHTWMRAEASLPSTPLAPTGTSTGPRPSPIERLRGLLHFERDAIAVVIVYAVAVGVLSLATPLAIQVLINWLAFGALVQPIMVLAGVLAVCLVLAVLMRSVQRYAVELVQRRIFVRTVTDLGTRLSRVRIPALDRHYGPELANRFFDVLTIQKAMSTLLVDGLTAALQAGVGLLLLAVYHPYLLVFDVIVVLLTAMALLPMLPSAQRTALEESRTKYAVAAWLEELARHPLVFKLGGLGLAESRLEALNREYLDTRTKHFRVFFGQYIGMQSVQALVQVGLLLTCGWLVLEGELTLGQLVAAEFIVTAALNGLSKFTEKLETIYDLLAGVDKLGMLIDLPHERTHGVWTDDDRGGGAAISVRALHFRHEHSGHDTLRGATAELAAGSRTGILGRPGSGKSTLADLLVGLREPTDGAVWRDGMPLSELLPDQVYAETMVLRSDGLIQGTVADNVTLGRAQIDERHVWQALSILDLDDCTAAMPMGLQTKLSPSGAPLSETQARALLLARAVVGAPRLLVIDSLYDGLAPAARDELMSAMQCIPAATTVVVLTEDPAIANRLDQVLELRDGGLHARPRLSTV